MKRVFVIVLDSCGIGFEPDAADFGDSRIAVLRMKELWFYFGNLFENSEKLQKSIKKAKNAEEFERAAVALFCSCEVRGNVVPAWFRPA